MHGPFSSVLNGFSVLTVLTEFNLRSSYSLLYTFSDLIAKYTQINLGHATVMVSV